jgi:hypothetical protein
MWRHVRKRFERQKARIDVIKKIIEIGACITKDGNLAVSDVELPFSSLARAINVDRRVVTTTVQQILKDEFLSKVFQRVKPVGINLAPIASLLGYSVLVITSVDPHKPGIIASVTTVLANHNVVIRQVLADDPDLVEEPKLTLVVDGDIPSEALNEIRKLDLVKSLTLEK